MVIRHLLLLLLGHELRRDDHLRLGSPRFGEILKARHELGDDAGVEAALVRGRWDRGGLVAFVDGLDVGAFVALVGVLEVPVDVLVGTLFL